MKVICNADGYTVEERSNYFLVTNRLYSSKLGFLLLTSALEMFIPDKTTYKIPKSVLINKNEDENVVEIDNKLNITGTSDFEYVLIKTQYKNWKHSYLIMNIMTVILSFVLVLFCLYITFLDGFKWIMLIPLIVVALFCVMLCRNTFKEVVVAKKIKKVDL